MLALILGSLIALVLDFSNELDLPGLNGSAVDEEAAATRKSLLNVLLYACVGIVGVAFELDTASEAVEHLR